MAKMWAGRFGKETDRLVDDFNTSLPFDCRLYREDITGSMAHAKMLGKDMAKAAETGLLAAQAALLSSEAVNKEIAQIIHE